MNRIGRRIRLNQVLAVVVLAAVPWAGAVVAVAQRLTTLEFRLIDDQNNPSQAQHCGKVPAGDELYRLRDGSAILLKRDLVAAGDEVAEAVAMTTSDGPSVYIRLDARGAASMLTATRQNLGHRLAVLYNGRVISADVIRGVFGPQYQITVLTIAETGAITMRFVAAAAHSSR